MSKKVLIILAIIVVVVVAGMVVTMKRSMKAGAANRDPDASVPARAPAQKP
jgi:flagellar basal body-associated protein FliL